MGGKMMYETLPRNVLKNYKKTPKTYTPFYGFPGALGNSSRTRVLLGNSYDLSTCTFFTEAGL